ncbi:CHAT domain-containing protein [Lentzea sp. NPDC058436]|uniref:CHAT domain-containing protein n=1 Tax=Lentzea sp. NPDC058436 TaxID=3346499 RepID=UPI003669BA55
MDPLSRLVERLWWFTSGGDPVPLLDDAALEDSQAVVRAALRPGADGFEVLDREAVAFAALAHWCRYTALPKGLCEGDYMHSLSLSQAIGFDDPGQITVAVQVGKQRVGLDTVDVAAAWARHVATRFDQSGDVEELVSATDYLRARITVLPDPRLLDAFAEVMYRRYVARPDQVWVLEEAVAAARRALGQTAEDDPRRDGRIHALGAVLAARDAATAPGEAAELLRALVSRTAEDDPGLPSYLLALSRTLPESDELYDVLTRAMEVTADPGLEMLVRYVGVLPSRAPLKVLGVRRAIITKMPAVHPDRSLHLVALADVLRIAGHGDEAIELLRSEDVRGPWRARALMVLSSALGTRFEERGAPADLDDAVSLAREADGLGDDLTVRATLALALLRRFEHRRGPSDLAESLRHLRDVTARADGDYPSLPSWRSNLAAALAFDGPASADEAIDVLRDADHGEGLALALVRRGKAGDLEEAVEVLRAVADGTPDDQPRKVVRLCNLGEALRVNAERRNDPAVLNDAVRVQREALDRCAPGSPERAWVLGSLASALLDRFARTHHLRDRADAVTALRAAVAHTPAPVGERTASAMRLGGIGAETGDAEAALAGFGGVVDLLPALLADGMARADHEHLLGSWQSLGNDAAAWALSAGKPERALELLERSRLLLSGGGEAFLDVGERTVVVVNVSRYRCDALVVSSAGVRVIPLRELTFADVTAKAHVFLGAQARLETRPLPLPEKVTLLDQVRETLDWLWRTTASPVLDALAPLPPRIWWSPTGLLSVLPLHAAGAYAGESVLDRVVSSYAGSLRMFARDGVERPAGSALVVAVPEAVGLPALHGVDEEVHAVQRAVPATVLRGSEATLAAVTAALADHDVVHFACHATQNVADPADTGIVLHDGKLDLAAIAAVPGGAHLAFLSACRTGAGAVDVPDEALHVAAGFQVAGFRHVVGTLWSVEDQSAAAFTTAVYARLTGGSALDPARTAFAVHEATLLARAQDRFDPMRWAQWFHSGP